MSTENALALWTNVRPKLGMSLMDHLFDRLSGKYSSRWTSQFKSDRDVENWRAEWSETFAKRGITPEEVARGLDACNDLYTWPPTLPEFLKACRPELDPMSAFREAVDQMARRLSGQKENWSSPAIYWAATRFGSYDLAHMNYDAAKARWTRLLAEASAEPPREIPEAPKPLPKKSNITPTAEAAAQLAKIKSMLSPCYAKVGDDE